MKTLVLALGLLSAVSVFADDVNDRVTRLEERVRALEGSCGGRQILWSCEGMCRIGASGSYVSGEGNSAQTAMREMRKACGSNAVGMVENMWTDATIKNSCIRN